MEQASQPGSLVLTSAGCRRPREDHQDFGNPGCCDADLAMSVEARFAAFEPKKRRSPNPQSPDRVIHQRIPDVDQSCNALRTRLRITTEFAPTAPQCPRQLTVAGNAFAVDDKPS